MVIGGSFIKVIGMKFNILGEVKIVFEGSAGSYNEAKVYAENCIEENVVFVGIPCTFTYKR